MASWDLNATWLNALVNQYYCKALEWHELFSKLSQWQECLFDYCWGGQGRRTMIGQQDLTWDCTVLGQIYEVMEKSHCGTPSYTTAENSDSECSLSWTFTDERNVQSSTQPRKTKTVGMGCTTLHCILFLVSLCVCLEFTTVFQGHRGPCHSRITLILALTL